MVRAMGYLWAAAWVLASGVAWAASGGPDTFGYVYASSVDPHGPASTFDDISSTGARLGLGDEGNQLVTLPFQFLYYGGLYSRIYVSANGGITTSNNSLPRTNTCLPSGVAPERYILPFWDDLDATTGGVYWQVKGPAFEQYVIVQWNQVRRVASTDVLTFQAVLFEDGTVEFRYRDLDNLGHTATIGLQRVSGDALSYGCNTDVLAPGEVVRFRPCSGSVDFDGDGADECEDCDDGADARYPGAAESCDGVDQDCDGVDGEDLDNDGWTVCERDCEDGDPQVNPAVAERACDGIDQDCDPWSLDDPDLDGDGQTVCSTDCDDGDDLVYTGAAELLCNGVDDDCDPSTLDDADADGDGYAACAGDCADGDPARHPGVAEVICNGTDDDCDLGTPEAPDADGDASTVCDGDCDDLDPAVNTVRAERPCNGVDDDCDPASVDDPDRDGDGHTTCGDDCDDLVAAVSPSADEVLCNYVDDDCNPRSEDDADRDRDGVSVCREDCDDADFTAGPGFVERCDDVVDNDCDGRVDEGCEEEVADTDAEETPRACGCAQGAVSGVWWMVGLWAVRRRRG
jgi:hypothetical protein